MEFSLEQLEAFAASVDAGSFSAAARRLGKAQSAVSTAVSNLEADLGVELFDRSGKYPRLTEEGTALLNEARGILERCTAFRDRAWAWAGGEGGVVRLAVDEVVPHELFTDVLVEFAQRFPGVELEVLYGVLGDVTRMIVDGRADMGILIPVMLPPRTVAHRLAGYLPFRPFAGAGHPLAALSAVTADDLSRHRQLLVTSRGGESEEVVYGSRVWKLENSYMIRDLVARGLGWSYLPDHLVEADVAAGRLVRLSLTEATMEHSAPIYVLRGRGGGGGSSGAWLAKALARVAGDG